MKIRSLTLEQFRKFDRAITIDGFGDGLNLIAGPNETGKSTLLLALRAALFERHSTKSDTVRDFSPRHITGARPTVTLDFEIDGERFRLTKSFLKRPSIRLEKPDGRRSEGHEAETELKELLGLNPSEKTPINKGSPAHFGVLLTPQAHSFHQPNLANGTRHSLEAAIAKEIADLDNQSEVDGLIAEFDTMQYRFVDKRGKPKGDYEKTVTRLAEIEHEIAEATEEQSTLREQFGQLAKAFAERNALQAADDGENLSERLTSLETARTEATQRQALENRRLEANQRLQAAEAKRAARQARLQERRRMADDALAIEKAAEDARHRLGMIEDTLSEHDGKLADLGEALRAASQKRRHLDALARQFERLSQIEATLSALATDVRLDLEATALDRVTVDGEPAPATSELRQVTEGLSIEIEGIGRIGIEPKIEPMREALAARAETENDIKRLLQALDLDGTDREAIEATFQATASEIDSLENAQAALEATLSEERQQAAEAKAVLDTATDRKAQLTQRLAELDTADSGDAIDYTALDTEFTDAKAALENANSALQAATQSEGPGASPAVETLDAEIPGLRKRIEERRRAIDEASKKVVALEAAIAVRSDFGLDEKIDQLERVRHLKAEECDAFALDHQALSLLQSTLRAAADEAKATFNAPLSARLAPYIQDLFPDATPVVTPDFSIRAIDRNGVEEPFLQLSDGTREQIAILARLAYADMLKEQGLPALIVLDDALAFSDDERLQRMFALLEKAAKSMQIIIFTCREDRFTGIAATRLAITPEAETASTAA